MGSCVSSNAISSVPEATAKLILMDGRIQEFCEEVRSQDILREYEGHVICNSDGLYVGEKISHLLRDDDQLEIGQLYFLLPQRKLQFLLTGSDMASLLLKSNNAWLSAAQRKKRSRKLSYGFGKEQAQVQPFFDIHNQQECKHENCWRPNNPISTGIRGPPQRQYKLETIVETV